MLKSVTAHQDGFIRFPRCYLGLDVSPGAKVLLLHLCASANDAGESWYGYEDIAILIGRSKASVTAYVQELAQADVIEVIEQKMANGFNYRRRLRLVEWPRFLAVWQKAAENKKSQKIRPQDELPEVKPREFSVTQVSGKSRDKFSECSVQPTERKDPSGLNNNQKNNSQAGRGLKIWTEEHEAEWRRFRCSDADPISSVRGLPSPTLLDHLMAEESRLELQCSGSSADQLREAARIALTDFAARNRLRTETTAIEAAAGAVARVAVHVDMIAKAIAILQDLWQPHWRQLPTERQIEKSLEGKLPLRGETAALRQRLAIFRNRIWVARLHMAKAGSIPAEAEAGRTVTRHDACMAA